MTAALGQDRKNVGRKEFTNKVQTKVSGNEGAEANSRSVDNRNVLVVVDKGVDKEEIAACFKSANN